MMIDDVLSPPDALVQDLPRAPRPAAFRRLGLVALSYAYRLVASVFIASPFAALLGGSVAHDPRGDASLFDPGGIMLLEALRLASRAASGAVTASSLSALVATFGGLFPFAMLVSGLGRKGRLSAGYLAARALRPIGTLALLWGLGSVAQAVFGGLTVLLGQKLLHSLALSTRVGDIGGLILAGVTLVPVLVVGVVRDIAAVAAVNDSSRFYTSVARALRVTFGSRGRVAVSYGVRGALALGAVAGSSVLVSSMTAGKTLPVGDWFLVHQAAIAFTVFMHASWLAAAIQLLDRFAPLPRPYVSAPVPISSPAELRAPTPVPASNREPSASPKGPSSDES